MVRISVMKLNLIESRIKYLLREAGEESIDTLVKMTLTEAGLPLSDLNKVLFSIRDLAGKGLIEVVLTEKTGANFIRKLEKAEIESLTNLFNSYKSNPDGSWTMRYELEEDSKRVYVVDSGLVDSD